MSIIGSKLGAKFYKTIQMPKIMFKNYTFDEYKIRKLEKHDLILVSNMWGVKCSII